MSTRKTEEEQEHAKTPRPEGVSEEEHRDALARASACMSEVEAVLAKHNCVISTRIKGEAINHGARLLLESEWAVIPRVEGPLLQTPGRPHLVRP